MALTESGALHSDVASALTQAAVYERDGSIAVREVALEAPRAGELLVRITACGICPGEVMRWYVGSKAPFVLGHEPVGVVQSCGEPLAAVDGAGRPFAAGERVFVHHHAPCMRCRFCARGDHVQCADWRAPGLRPGGMAAFAIVATPNVRTDVLRIPDEIEDEVATFIEPLATVVKSLRRARVRPGDRMLVIGLGVMGMLHALYGKRQGVEITMGADGVASRLKRAAQMGFDAVFDVRRASLAEQVRQVTGGQGADVVVVCPGSTEAIDTAASCVARGGTIVLFTPTPPLERWPMPVNDLYFKDVSVVTSYSAGPADTRAALDVLTAGLPVKRLITHRFPLGRAADAYDLVERADEALKVIVHPSA